MNRGMSENRVVRMIAKTIIANYNIFIRYNFQVTFLFVKFNIWKLSDNKINYKVGGIHGETLHLGIVS